MESDTPDAQHVLTRSGGTADEALQVLVADPRGVGVGGDPIGTFGEDGHVVDHKAERLPPLIVLLTQSNGTQAHLVGAVVVHLAL
jgi:hypothetical protein